VGYLFLAFAIVCEVIATTFLRVASGDNAKWWAYIIVGVGYILSFVMLSLTLRSGIPLGITYAVWAAVGIVLVAVISWLAFGEMLSWQQLAGIGLVIAGVVLLELNGNHAPSAG
jgi:small multidrug resistance pump